MVRRPFWRAVRGRECLGDPSREAGGFGRTSRRTGRGREDPKESRMVRRGGREWEALREIRKEREAVQKNREGSEHPFRGTGAVGREGRDRKPFWRTGKGREVLPEGWEE